MKRDPWVSHLHSAHRSFCISSAISPTASSSTDQEGKRIFKVKNSLIFASILIFLSLLSPLAPSHGLGAPLGSAAPFQEQSGVWTDQSTYAVGETVTITMAYTQMLGVKYWVVVYKPDGSSFPLDFAMNSDYVTTTADQAGGWRVELWSQIVAPNSTPELRGTCTFTAGEFADVVVSSCWISPQNPRQEDSVTFYAQIGNIGGSDAPNVEIDSYLDGSPFSSERVSLPAGSSGEWYSTQPWIAQDGSHTLHVVANADHSVPESNYDNNDASCTFVVSPRTITATISVTQSITRSQTSWTTTTSTIPETSVLTSVIRTTSCCETYTANPSWVTTTTTWRTYTSQSLTETDVYTTTSTTVVSIFTSLTTSVQTVPGTSTAPPQETTTVLTGVVTQTIFSPTITTTVTVFGAAFASQASILGFVGIAALLISMPLGRRKRSITNLIHLRHDPGSKIWQILTGTKFRQTMVSFLLLFVSIAALVVQPAAASIVNVTTTTTQTVYTTNTQYSTATKLITSITVTTSYSTSLSTETTWVTPTSTTTYWHQDTTIVPVTYTLSRTITSYSTRYTSTTSTITSPTTNIVQTVTPTITRTLDQRSSSTTYVPTTTTTTTILPHQGMITDTAPKLIEAKVSTVTVWVKNTDPTTPAQITITAALATPTSGWTVDNGQWPLAGNSITVTAQPSSEATANFRVDTSNPFWCFWCSPTYGVGNITFTAKSSLGGSDQVTRTIRALWPILQVEKKFYEAQRTRYAQFQSMFEDLYINFIKKNPNMQSYQEEHKNELMTLYGWWQSMRNIANEAGPVATAYNAAAGAAGTGMQYAQMIDNLLKEIADIGFNGVCDPQCIAREAPPLCTASPSGFLYGGFDELLRSLDAIITETGKDNPSASTVRQDIRNMISAAEKILGQLEILNGPDEMASTSCNFYNMSSAKNAAQNLITLTITDLNAQVNVWNQDLAYLNPSNENP